MRARDDAFRISFTLLNGAHIPPATNGSGHQSSFQHGGEAAVAWTASPYSHSIVPGGFDVMSYTTRLIPTISFTIRLEIRFSTSYGSGTQSAVIPSSECTARIAQVYA